jgi:hypothetical protein
VWYGPLFGKKWMEVVGATAMDVETRKKMQKAAGPLYLVQFLLTLFQAYILAYSINVWYLFTYGSGGVLDAANGSTSVGVKAALLIWAAFIMPIVAGSSMWNNDSKKIAWTRFLLQAGYQLLLFVVFGLILSYWK